VELSCQPPVSKDGHLHPLDTVPIPMILYNQHRRNVRLTGPSHPSRVSGFQSQLRVSFDMRFFTSACGRLCQESRFVRADHTTRAPACYPSSCSKNASYRRDAAEGRRRSFFIGQKITCFAYDRARGTFALLWFGVEMRARRGGRRL
jgi:hypothetical protein